MYSIFLSHWVNKYERINIQELRIGASISP